MLLADKGYDANALRATVCEHDAWANIPPKANRKDPICFSPYLYKAHNLSERFFNKIEHYRGPQHVTISTQKTRSIEAHCHSHLAAP